MINEQEKKKIKIEIGVTQIHSLSLNKNKVFILDEESFTNAVPIVLNFKAENCNLTLYDISSHTKISSNYYQFVYSTPNNYTIETSIDFFFDKDNKNPNDICMFYSYATEKGNTYYIVALEGIAYQTISEMDNPVITFQFPFFLDNDNFCFVLEIEPSPSLTTTTYLRLSMNNLPISSMIHSIFYPQNYFFSNSLLQNFCSLDDYCLIKLEIASYSNPNLIHVRFKARQLVPIFINANTMIKDQIIGQFERVFYTPVKKGDKGNIKIICNNQGLIFYYKIVERGLGISRSDLVYEWDFVSDYITGEGEYEIKKECNNGCLLYIKVISNSTVDQISKQIINYGIFIANNDDVIIGLKTKK